MIKKKQASIESVTSDPTFTSASGTSTITIKGSVYIGKSLTINIPDVDGIPRYDFIGNWTARDVTTIRRLMHQAYAKHQQAIRQRNRIGGN